MEITYNGELYDVKGAYIKAVPGRPYYDDLAGNPGEPADYKIESVVWCTHNESGHDILIDVTDEFADDLDFINTCINEYEEYYAYEW